MYQVVFYETQAGNEVVLDFLRSLSIDDKKKIGEDLKTLQFRFPMGMPLCRSLGNGLMELRSSLPSKRESRVVFTFDQEIQAIVVLHAFIKKAQKTPKTDLDLARSRKAEFQMKGG